MAEKKFIIKANGVYKRNYTSRINIMEEICQIRSGIEILANSYNWTVYYVVQLIKIYKIYILQDHPLRGKSGLNMYDIFWDDYKVFVLGELTEL